MQVTIDETVLRDLIDSCYRYESDSDDCPVCGSCGHSLFKDHNPECAVEQAREALGDNQP